MDGLSKKANDVCSFLDKLGIEYSAVRHAPAFTIDECKNAEKLIGGKICKNLFLRTSSGDIRYLLLMDGNKRFVTKEVSKSLGTSRLSFASKEEMEEVLNTSAGSLSITSLIFNNKKNVFLAIDEDVLKEEYICCHPSDNNATLKIKTSDILEIFLPHVGITPETIEITGQ